MKGANVTFNFRQDKGEDVAVMEIELYYVIHTEFSEEGSPHYNKHTVLSVHATEKCAKDSAKEARKELGEKAVFVQGALVRMDETVYLG